MATKRKHHVLPRLYLQGFAESDQKPFVWVYTKGRDFNPGPGRDKHNPVRTSIRSASVIHDAYSYERADGTVDADTYENALERLEKPSDSILRKIRNKTMVDEEEKWILSSYILLMHKRVPQRDTRLKEHWKEAVAESQTLKILRSPALLSTLSEARRAEVERVLQRFANEEPPREVALRAMVGEWREARACLAAMAWRCLIATEDSRFVTGDNPVFTSGLGLNKLASELTFPISTDIMLHCSWQPGREGFVVAPRRYVKQLNQRTASNSRQLFYYRPEQWVLTILNRGGYPAYLLDVSGCLPRMWQDKDLQVWPDRS